MAGLQLSGLFCRLAIVAFTTIVPQVVLAVNKTLAQ